MALEEGMDRMW